MSEQADGVVNLHSQMRLLAHQFVFMSKATEKAMDKIGLTLNANSVADDPLPPFRPSGIRLGTPAVTTRGLKEEHMAQIAEWMKQAIDARDDEATLAKLAEEVKTFTAQFPLPSDK